MKYVLVTGGGVKSIPLTSMGCSNLLSIAGVISGVGKGIIGTELDLQHVINALS